MAPLELTKRDGRLAVEAQEGEGALVDGLHHHTLGLDTQSAAYQREDERRARRGKRRA